MYDREAHSHRVYYAGRNTQTILLAVDERLRRWRLVLGGDDADGTGATLSADDLRMDQALAALYETARKGGLGTSAPRVARWLGDIRSFFPAPVVRVLQRDALERLDLRKMLLEPELIEAVVPDVHLVAALVSLAAVLPSRARESARRVVRRVTDELVARLAEPMRQAVTGSLARSLRTRRPRPGDVDWNRTIRANLKHYQPPWKTVLPVVRHGHGRRRSALRDVILCVDQSGSMAASVVYVGIFAAVLASLPALATHLVVFDVNVVDLTAQLADPVDVLFGVQLGGGTDINRAVAHCQTLVTRPRETVLVLVSDLFEGGDREDLLKRVGVLARAGVRIVALLALSDEGAPAYDHALAAELAARDVPAFACTPDLFPELMSAALAGRDVAEWASGQGIMTAR
jgi:Mg-chelatase subunit ChlD